MATFRLAHALSYDPLSVTHCLSLKAPRLSTPHQWHWTWPSPDDESTCSWDGIAISAARSPVRHVWVSAIRSVAVSDDARCTAFLSQHGSIALSFRGRRAAVPVRASPHAFHDPQHEVWAQVATTVRFVTLDHPSRLFLAVGYVSGALALFLVEHGTKEEEEEEGEDCKVRLIALTKLPSTDPVRVIRFDKHVGLSALVGWAGVVACLPYAELCTLVLRSPPVVDTNAAGWLVWTLAAQDAIMDAVPCRLAPVSPFEDHDQTEERDRLLTVVTVGANPPAVLHHASSRAPFSARAAAARVATSFMSVARGFLLSRLTADTDPISSTAAAVDADDREAVIGGSNHVAAWADDAAAYATASFKIGDARLAARRVLAASFKATLQRRSRTGSGTHTSRTATQSLTGVPVGTTTKSSSAPQNSTATGILKSNSNKVKQAVAAAATTLTSASYSEKREAFKVMSNADVVKKVHSMTGSREDVAGLLSRYTKNNSARIIERIASSPYPSTLLASCDSLGRILVQDHSDFSVIRVFKGYRNANIAWMNSKIKVGGECLLAVHAPKLNVVEVHGVLDTKRKQAFRVLPGTSLVQSTNHSAFCVFPDGRIFEIVPSNSPSETLPGTRHETDSTDLGDNVQPVASQNTPSSSPRKNDKVPSPDVTANFLEAVQSGRAGRAVECMDKVADSAHQVAHFMAALVATTSGTRPDVHIALASKAGYIATRLQNPDLVCRFEAHRRLAEAFQLIEAEPNLLQPSADQIRPSARYGAKLIDTHIGTGLLDVGLAELKGKHVNDNTTRNHTSNYLGTQQVEHGGSRITCEQFILSHYLVPTVDLHVDAEYEILPRPDLSAQEQAALAAAYFAKLLEVDPSMYAPTPGREHPATAEIFAALAHYVGLSEAEITRQFVAFFLAAPLVPLLNAHVAPHASPLHCTLARILLRFTPDVVDAIILDACEATTRIANAVLLVRLCTSIHRDTPATTHTDDTDNQSDADNDEDTNAYAAALDRLNEALVFHKLTAGFTSDARRFSGRRGEGELTAVAELLRSGDFARVKLILDGQCGTSVRTLTELAPSEVALVSLAAVEFCRKRVAHIVTARPHLHTIPPNVAQWIRSANAAESDDAPAQRHAEDGDQKAVLVLLTQMRAVLIAAHVHIPDSSVDAVRSLQLAEAISALIEHEDRTISKPSDDEDFHDAPELDAPPAKTGPDSQDAGSLMEDE